MLILNLITIGNILDHHTQEYLVNEPFSKLTISDGEIYRRIAYSKIRSESDKRHTNGSILKGRVKKDRPFSLISKIFPKKKAYKILQLRRNTKYSELFDKLVPFRGLWSSKSFSFGRLSTFNPLMEKCEVRSTSILKQYFLAINLYT